MYTMTDKKNISLTSAFNGHEIIDCKSDYTEIDNISLYNTATKKFMCQLCDFKSNNKVVLTNKRGMKA